MGGRDFSTALRFARNDKGRPRTKSRFEMSLVCEGVRWVCGVYYFVYFSVMWYGVNGIIGWRGVGFGIG